MASSKLNVASMMADVALSSREMSYAFKLKTACGIGTCFLYGTEDGFFFVSAAHLLKGIHTGEIAYLEHESGWRQTTITSVKLHPDGHDVAVFTSDLVIEGEPEFDNRLLVMPGQAVKFVGFPHGLTGNYPSPSGFLTPLVRSAHFSGVVQHNKLLLHVLDGFNNPGYSGGAVYCCGDDGEAKLFGVISSYRYEAENHSRIYKKTPEGDYEPIPDYIVRLNSGMIYMTGIGECRDLFSSIKIYQPRKDEA